MLTGLTHSLRMSVELDFGGSALHGVQLSLAPQCRLGVHLEAGLRGQQLPWESAPTAPVEAQRARAPARAHFQASAGITSAIFSLAKASHVAEPKYKGCPP